MSIIMKDQARRIRVTDGKKEVEEILIKMLTAFFVFIAATILFVIFSLEDAHGHESVTDAAYDNLISEDMAAFIAMHPGEYTEQDMQ